MWTVVIMMAIYVAWKAPGFFRDTLRHDEPEDHDLDSSDAEPHASFTYVDAQGVVTDRQLRDWYSEGPYIKGFCLTAQATRTFRKDRIEDWITYAEAEERA